MKTFENKNSLDEVLAKLKELGYKINDHAFKNGSDWITGIKKDKNIAFSSVSYWFCITDADGYNVIATISSTELDDVEWYKEILNVFWN